MKKTLNIFESFGYLVILIALLTLISSNCSKSTCPLSLPADKQSQSNETPKVLANDDRLPEFDIARFDGGTLSSGDIVGKPVMIVFWTAWCPACKEEAPQINRIAADFEPKGLSVIGINIGESDARIREGIRDFGIKYVVAKDSDASVARSFGVVGTPTVFIVDRDGMIRYKGNEIPKNYVELLESITASDSAT